MEINVGGKKGLSGFGRVLFVLLALVTMLFVKHGDAKPVAAKDKMEYLGGAED